MLSFHSLNYKAVASGLGGEFIAKQLTLSQPGGRLYLPQYYHAPPPDFQTLRRAWINLVHNLNTYLAQPYFGTFQPSHVWR